MQQPLTPAEIVSELDKYIIGQNDAKRMVAIALRNRWRRQQVPENLRDEITPKNIIMIGPTLESAKRKSPDAWRISPSLRSSRSRPASSPKSATWDGMWNR